MKRITVYIFFVFALSYLHAQTDTTPPATPQGFKSISYEQHIDLIWQPNTETDLAGYKIYKWNGTSYQFQANVKKYRSFYWEWFGSTSVSNKYKITAYDLSGNESQMSAEVSTLTHQMTDEEFLDMTQRAVFRYFWDWADPNSGIARERWEPNEADVTNTIGGGGFGVMAIIVGIERGFITRDQGIARMQKILDFLANKIEKFHGAFSHWFNGSTGKVVNFGQQNGGDIVETAYMMEGLLTARQYFNQQNTNETQIRNLIKQIWEGVDWDFYRNGSSGLYWNWSPTMGFNFSDAFIVHGWSETLISYILAIASPTHPSLLPNASQFYRSGWGNGDKIRYGKNFYGYDLAVGSNLGGPLFWTHYSFLGFDPREKRDWYANYFVHNKNQSLINRAYCIENPKKFSGYNENCWGLTASYSIPGVGYTAHEPGTNDNGTISPTAALSAMPYFLYEKENYSLNAIKYFYRTFGSALWSDFGFTDAFNLSKPWFCDSYLAIDQGPIVCMIENYRSQLLWKNFMADPDIQAALTKIPFFPDPTDVKEENNIPDKFLLRGNYPNPFNPSTIISYRLSAVGHVQLRVYDILGREVSTLVNEEQQPGEHNIKFNANSDSNQILPSGNYFYRIQVGDYSASGKMVLIK